MKAICLSCVAQRRRRAARSCSRIGQTLTLCRYGSSSKSSKVEEN